MKQMQLTAVNIGGSDSNAVVLNIFRFIPSSPAANWDEILKNISSRFAMCAIGIPISEPKLPHGLSLAKNSYFAPSEVTSV